MAWRSAPPVGSGWRTARGDLGFVRANAIMERWVGSLRREILGRILIVNPAHLRMVLAEYETHAGSSSFSRGPVVLVDHACGVPKVGHLR
jgi:hypothetical protein